MYVSFRHHPVGFGLQLKPSRHGAREDTSVDMVMVRKTITQVQAQLTPDLLEPAWRIKNQQEGNRFVGHCYVGAEALYYKLGGKKAGWVPHVLSHHTWPEGLDAGETHWFLKHKTGKLADPTAEQFDGQPIAYERGRPNGFLTNKPSRRASIVLSRINHANN